jgi:hypothetical protein
MEGQFFLTAIGGLAVSLAGFAGLIAAFRLRADWDPVNLWRVKTIVGDAFITAFAALALIPIFSITADLPTTVRIGSGVFIVAVSIELLRNRRFDPEVWVSAVSHRIFIATNVGFALLQVANLWLASLGILQLSFLIFLSSPAAIFGNFVRELGRPEERVE